MNENIGYMHGTVLIHASAVSIFFLLITVEIRNIFFTPQLYRLKPMRI
jgi:hypothetical protein